MNKHLEMLYGLRWQIRKDNTKFKEFLFDGYIKRKPTLARIYNFFSEHKTSWLGLLICRAFFVLTYMSILVPKRPEVLTVLIAKNEKKSFREVIQLKNHTRVNAAKKKPLFILLNALKFPRLTSINRFIELSRVFKILTRNYPLFVALRAVEYLAYYTRLSPHFKNAVVRSVLVFSDGNPNGIALIHLSKRYSKELIFISHGEPNEPIYPLECKAALLWGGESLRRYSAAKARIEEVVFRGNKGSLVKMKTLPKHIGQVGIFLSKMTSIPKIVCIINKVVDLYQASLVLIRPHPNFALSKKMKNDLLIHPTVRISASEKISKDLEDSDLVLAGNTTAHPEILLGGTPSLYCFDLENIDFDRCGYVKQGLILEWTPDLKISRINDFYSRTDIINKLGLHFDLNVSKEKSFARINNLIFES